MERSLDTGIPNGHANNIIRPNVIADFNKELAALSGKRTRSDELDSTDRFDTAKRRQDVVARMDGAAYIDGRSTVSKTSVDAQESFSKTGFELERMTSQFPKSPMSKAAASLESPNEGREVRLTWEKFRPEGLKSEMWQYFQKFTNKRMPHVVVCDLCGKEVLVGLKGSTTNMKNHLKSHHPHLFANLRVRQGFQEPILLAAGQANFLDSFLRWQTQTFQPSNVSEHPCFTAMIAASQRAKNPLACRPAQDARREELKATVEGWLQKGLQNQPLAISVESWTTINQETYFSFIAHTINKDWELLDVTLDCSLLPAGQSSMPMEVKIDQLMEKYRLKRDHISAFVNGSATSTTEISMPFPSFGSIDRALESAAGKFLGSPYFASSFTKCLELVSHINQSSKSAAALQDACICTNCIFVLPTFTASAPWYSKYIMLEQMQHLKIPLQSMGSDLNESDWKFVEMAVRFLQPLTEARKILQSTTYVSISMIPQVIVTLQTILRTLVGLVKSQEGQVAGNVVNSTVEVCSSMLHELVNPYGKGLNPVNELPMEITLAQALDPRTRFFIENYSESDQQEIWGGVKKWAARLAMDDVLRQELQVNTSIKAEPGFPSYHLTNIETNPAPNGNVFIGKVSPKTTEKKSDSITFEGLWQSMQAKRAYEPQPQGLSQLTGQITDSMLIHILEVEIAKFIAIPCISEDDDPILWWKQHNRMFPNLAELARTLLCIPAMPRRIRSDLNMVNSMARRDNLTGDDVPTIVFLHGSWEIAQRFSHLSRGTD